MSVAELFTLIVPDPGSADKAIASLIADGSVIIEGKLASRNVQLHSMIDIKARHLQTAIMDTTDSHMAEEGFRYTAEALARAAEAYDESTGLHIRRINLYSERLAGLLGLQSSFVESISLLAQLHDVGKVHINQGILRKPAELTPKEYEIMKEHTVLGAKIIGDHQRLALARQIALSHHEKWDGSGYPNGFCGEMIPLSARIVAIVDCFDAIVSKRSYKAALSYERAYELMTKGDERSRPEGDFCPQTLSVFIENFDAFVETHENNTA